jgi:hypothetical protein
VDDEVRERLELLAVELAVQAGAGAARVVEGDLARLVEAPVAATRTRAPSIGPPASARRTTSSSRAARISGSVGVPSRRSTPATLPVSIVSPRSRGCRP